MISTLSQYDNLTAAGILARAAFALEEGESNNPAAQYKLPEEIELRKALMREARARLGVRSDDDSRETLDRVGDLLDRESDSLLAPIDEEATLKILSDKGELPSDLFNIQLNSILIDVYREDFLDEKVLIEETIKTPDREQNLEPSVDEDAPFMITLFAKRFANKFPLKSFTMLVAGKRIGLNFVVHQAWRIYPHLINMHGATTLVELLKRFAEVFGVEVTVGEIKGKFILSTEIPANTAVHTTYDFKPRLDKKGNPIEEDGEVVISLFRQPQRLEGSTQAALVIAIDVKKYRAVRLSLK